jgi:hypothetical protein
MTDELATFAALHEQNLQAKEEATDAPFTEAEMEEIRARARGDAKDVLCIDYWSDDLKPKNHQLRPGALSLKGAPTNAGCRYMLADAYPFTSDRNKDGFKYWMKAHLDHKAQCAACRSGMSIL